MMKLVFAIIHDDDSRKVINELNKNGFRVTKLSSTGGFLKSGNTTLIIGVEESMVETVIKLIKKNSKSRRQLIHNTIPPMDFPISPDYELSGTVESLNAMDDLLMPYTDEVTVGGATIFVVSLDSKFHNK